MAKEVLGVIVARGGSKSIPKKSIYPCAGEPLMYYTIRAAQKAKTLTRIIISTDDEEMASFAQSHGVEVPFMRPKHLAEDTTPDLPVFQHVLKTLAKEGYTPDIVVHLRPTTPLKHAEDIDRGVTLLLENPDADSVRSMCTPLHTPFKMYRIEDGNPYLEPLLKETYKEFFEKYPEAYNMPRQLLPKVWRHSGYVDIVRPEVIRKGSMSGKKILPFIMDDWRDIDIDTMHDIKLAEQVILSLRAEGKDEWK